MQSSRELLSSFVSGADGESRKELSARYRPILAAFARRVGMGSGEIDRVCDETLDNWFAEVASDGFEEGVSMNELVFEQAKTHIAGASLSASDLLQRDEALLGAWNSEWRRALIRFTIQTLARSRETDARTLEAFELHVVEKRSAADVAKELGMTHTAVFGAKNLLLGKLQKLLGSLEEEF